MNDIREIRENPAEFKRRIETRNIEVDVAQLLKLDEKRRALITEVEAVKAERNAGSKLVGKTKDAEARQALIASMGGLGDKITALDAEANAIDAALTDLLSGIPNLPDPEVPIGKDEHGNVPSDERGAPLRPPSTSLLPGSGSSPAATSWSSAERGSCPGRTRGSPRRPGACA